MSYKVRKLSTDEQALKPKPAERDAPTPKTAPSKPAPPAPAANEATPTPVPRTELPPREPDVPKASIATDGDLTIAPGSNTRESIHAGGRITIGKDAHVGGGVTTLRDAIVDAGVVIDGPLDVRGSIRWGHGARAKEARIEGPLVTDDGKRRMMKLVARRGIHAGAPDPNATKEVRL